ncbi:MAG TPA: secretin N-terminal domain-containing protein [Candidatus Babeliales bacterium]|nr:secretin N-terminal domain-containing protein [Candidatus Babeliales bacterium]
MRNGSIWFDVTHHKLFLLKSKKLTMNVLRVLLLLILSSTSLLTARTKKTRSVAPTTSSEKTVTTSFNSQDLAPAPNLKPTKDTPDFQEFNFPAAPEELVGLDSHATKTRDTKHSLALNHNSINPDFTGPELTSDLDLDQDTPFSADISLNFENASLLNFLKKVELIFKVSFVFDEDIKPTKEPKSKDSNKELDPYSNNPKEDPANPANSTASTGNSASKTGLENSKISFATNQPLTKRELWHLTDQFLKVAGYARVRITGVNEPIYRITALGTAMQEVVPVFINVDANKITESGVIRYIYFLKNSTPAQMLEVLDKIKSKFAKISSFANLRALIFTDTAYNIKSLMEIVRELDGANTPEMLSIIKLKKADAAEIADLIKKLASGKDTGADKYGYQSPFAKSNKLSSSLKEARVIVESRSNPLLILGSRTAIATVEQIVQEFDTDLQRRRTNFWVVPLNHTPAKQMADLLNKVTQFGADSTPGAAGANLGAGQARLHGQDRLFGNLHFEPEGQGNNLVIRGEPEDYKLVLEVIKQLDRKQPQVAIEAIVVTLKTEDTQGLWAQINSAQNRKVNAATSGWGNQLGAGGQVVTDTTTGSLIGNLLTLAQNPVTAAGTTLISIGKSSAWALIGIISKFVRTNVIASPFVIATNKYPARVSVGQTRRVQSGTVVATGNSQSTIQQMSANLQLDIIPQINPNGMISLEVMIKLEDFTNAIDDPNNPSAGDTSIKLVQTCTNVANGEVLALGGLIKRTTTSNESNVPILSKIPIIGNLFRNRTDEYKRDTLLIFITPRIINNDQDQTCTYTLNKSEDLQQALGEIDSKSKNRDPIVKWFFKDYRHEETNEVQKFVDRRQGAPGAVCLAPVGAPAAQLETTATAVPPRRKSALLASVPNHYSEPETTAQGQAQENNS